MYGGALLARYRSYAYDENGFVRKVTECDADSGNRNYFSIEYTQDGFERIASRTVTVGSLMLVRSYNYGYNIPTYRVGEIQDRIGTNYRYTRYFYDETGNITLIIYIKENTTSTEQARVSYEYDALHQLVRENNGLLGKTYVYTYDNGGNRTSRKTYAYTTGTLGAVLETASYTYEGDRILSVGGSSVIYDGIGNPTSYRGNALTWNRRSLLSYGNNTFVYNSDGIRVKKTVNGVEHNYILNDTQIVAEVIGGTKTLYYFYDQNGVPTAFRLDENGTQTWYAYETNMQGDVTGIRTTDGTQVVSYTYDAWGRCTVSGSQPALGALNPLRYRGYYYDAETELYYLNSRYYDPDTGRFLNADGYINANGDLLGYNMYVYCGNNPANRFDPLGKSWQDIKDYCSTKWNNFKNFVKSTFGAGSSTTRTKVLSEKTEDVIPMLVTSTVGVQESVIESQYGDSSKPISVYANGELEDLLKSSSAGLVVNGDGFNANLNVALDNVGLSYSWSNGNTTNSFGLRVNLTKLEVGVEWSTTISWDANHTRTTYTNYSITGAGILTVLVLVTTGQYVRNPAYN